LPADEGQQSLAAGDATWLHKYSECGPITPRYRFAVALGVGLGLREGETFGLTIPPVDFLRRKVQVLSQAQ
jgi:integrase